MEGQVQSCDVTASGWVALVHYRAPWVFGPDTAPPLRSKLNLLQPLSSYEALRSSLFKLRYIPAGSLTVSPRALESRSSPHSLLSAMGDPRESSSYSVIPRIRYNTVGGVNGPLVILENVWCAGIDRGAFLMRYRSNSRDIMRL